MSKLKYSYLIQFIGDENEDAYLAVIPKFPKLYIMADTIKELHEAVEWNIKDEIKELKEKGKPIPVPDIKSKFSGKVMLRIAPTLHEKISSQAQANQLSLNKYITQKLEDACG